MGHLDVRVVRSEKLELEARVDDCDDDIKLCKCETLAAFSSWRQSYGCGALTAASSARSRAASLGWAARW